MAKCGALLTILLAVAFHTGTARADSSLFVGVGEDNLMGRPYETMSVAGDLGVSAFRLSLLWTGNRTILSAGTRAGLDNAVVAAGATRIVLAVYGESGAVPLTPADRDDYCTFVRNALEAYPQINDVVVWNEPNLTFYWWHQFNPDGSSAAPAAYQALLARCWDVLHEFRPSVNLIGPVVSLWGNDNPDAFSNVSHSPLNFIRKLGEAYRASGRTRPILDTFGHHPHPPRADERPWRQHDSVYVSIGDWGKLMDALTEAFEGTAQPLPGQGPSIWWLEVGYQTTVDEDKQHLYQRQENWRGPVPDFVGGEPDFPPPPADSPAPDQATQLIDSLRLSYCQPYVGAFFNFLLWDEPSLARWQSGVLWVDGSPKGSYDSFKQVIAEVNERRVDCSRLKGGPPFASDGPLGTTAGPDPLGTTAGSREDSRRRWDELGPILRPSGKLPSGFFSTATPSRLTYSGTRSGPFGFVTLRARLTAADRPIGDRTVTFVAGGESYSAKTNGSGVATVLAAPPVPVGSWRVQLRFLGDPIVRPETGEARVEVVNTRAQVLGVGTVRAGEQATGSFRVSSNGRKVRGKVRFRAPGLDLRAERLTALGVGKRGRAAWFTGFNRKGKRFWAYTEDNARKGRPDRVKLWVGGARIVRGQLRAGDIKITMR